MKKSKGKVNPRKIVPGKVRAKGKGKRKPSRVFIKAGYFV